MMEQEIASRLHAVIDGHVQGVGFRMFVMDQAQALKLTGWVRNTHSGKVEVTAEGNRSSLDTLLARLRQGPRSAFVTEVKAKWSDATGEFQRFDVYRTV
jgi:acylphosphatase